MAEYSRPGPATPAAMNGQPFADNGVMVAASVFLCAAMAMIAADGHAQSLPAGWQVVEYLDTADFPSSPGGHYFYSAVPGEQAAVDGGGAGRFVRTGKSFNVGGPI